MQYQFETTIPVRDYECDIQGIVNNANYLHYTEHTRHLFLKSRGLTFATLHAQGIDCVVARMQLQYKQPLCPDDIAISRLWVEKQGIRYVFHHDIFKKAPDNSTSASDILCHHADVEVVALINGRLGESEVINKALL